MLRRAIVISLSGLFFLIQNVGLAQCAMCRTQIVNNVSHGETSFAAGLNTGIMYLFFTPYVLIAVLAYLWYRNSKKSEGVKRVISRT